MNKIVGLLFILSVPFLHAQTAAELERILAISTVSSGDAAWLILSAGDTAVGTVPSEISVSEAYDFARKNRWLTGKARAEEAITLGEVSFLIMKALNLKGGLMYSLFPGPRYAYRELISRDILQGKYYSSLKLSGERLLRILHRALEYSEGHKNELRS